MRYMKHITENFREEEISTLPEITDDNSTFMKELNAAAMILNIEESAARLKEIKAEYDVENNPELMKVWEEFLTVWYDRFQDKIQDN